MLPGIPSEEAARAEPALDIWDNDAIRATKAAPPIAEEGEFEAADLIEIDRLLTACGMALDRPSADEKITRSLLTDLKNGCGCWLDFVERAILKANLPGEDRRSAWRRFICSTSSVTEF